MFITEGHATGWHSRRNDDRVVDVETAAYRGKEGPRDGLLRQRFASSEHQRLPE